MRVELPAHGWEPRAHQADVWAAMEAHITNILLVAHRRFGKDELGLNDCAVRAAETAANYFYMLPEQEHTRRAIWTSINPHTGRRRVDEAFPSGFRIGNFKENEMAIDVHSAGNRRSRIQFLGSDNYDAIVGASPFGLYFSEWAQADAQALAILRPIIEENGGFIRFLTTPRGENHVYTQMKEMVGQPKWSVHYINALQTNVFNEQQLDTLRRESVMLYGADVGESLFRQEYLCTFEEITPGSFYIDLIARLEKLGRMCGILPVPEEPVYAAFDLGWNAPTAIWYAQVRRDNQVDLIGYDEFHKLSVADIVAILKQRPWPYGALLLPHDAAHHEITSGETVETILTRNGFTCYIMPRTDEAPQIQSVRLLLPRCNFNERECQRGITCLKAYHNRYKTDTKSWTPNAVHDWSSHGSKAFATLAYFAPSLRRGVSGAKHLERDFMGEDRPARMQEGLGWMR